LRRIRSFEVVSCSQAVPVLKGNLGFNPTGPNSYSPFSPSSTPNILFFLPVKLHNLPKHEKNHHPLNQFDKSQLFIGIGFQKCAFFIGHRQPHSPVTGNATT